MKYKHAEGVMILKFTDDAVVKAYIICLILIT